MTDKKADRWAGKRESISGQHEKGRERGGTDVPMWKVPQWEPEDIPYARLIKSDKKKKTDSPPPLLSPHPPLASCDVQSATLLSTSSLGGVNEEPAASLLN